MEENEIKIRRINVMGGPGSGKSITATNIRAQMGFRGYNIELVEEVIKDWTYIPRPPKSCDSYYLQACQIEKEEIRLRAGVDLVVTDSPILLQFFYARHHNVPLQAPMLLTSQIFDKRYPPLYIFVDREDEFYGEVGRYEDIGEAKVIDRKMKQLMDSLDIEFKIFSCLDQEAIVEYIVSQTGPPNAQKTENTDKE